MAERSTSPVSYDKKILDEKPSYEVETYTVERKPPRWRFLGHSFGGDREIFSDGGEDFDKRPDSNRRIGYLSATMIIVNTMIGTGIFATPASILAASGGSVGLALFLWVIGALIAGSGLAVYLEWATSFPRSGGEKNYLEYFYNRPHYLISCTFAAFCSLLGWSAGNSAYAGTMFLNAAKVEVTRWPQRSIGAGVITFGLLVHALIPNWGLRLQNALGIFKLVVLLFTVITGFVALGGHVPGGKPNPSNFSNAFEGASSIDATSFVKALYSIIFSYSGYANVFYTLSEVQNPIRTSKRSAPLALAVVTVLYILVNIAYFAAVPKAQILSSDRLLAAEFFGVMFGDSANRAISVLIGLSAVGNSMSVIFVQGRINQELGREGVLPFSRFFASNKPFDTPLAGLLLQWAAALIIILAPPAGDVYGFLLNLMSYPNNIFHMLVAFGLVVIYLRRDHYNWNPPVKATLPVTVFFFLSNLFLLIVPCIKPSSAGSAPYKTLPYYLHVVVAFGVLGLGGVYWIVWSQILPRIGGYKLLRREELGSDGLTRNVFYHEKNE